MPTFFPAADTETTELDEKQVSIAVLHLIFHSLTVAQVLFCSLKKGITPKICMVCFVLVNSLLFNLLCVWIKHSVFSHTEIKPIQLVSLAQHQQTLEKKCVF